MKFWKWYKVCLVVGFGMLLLFLGWVYINQGNTAGTSSPTQTNQSAPAKKSPFVTN